MIIPGIVSATFKTRSIKDVLSLAKKAKLEAIEWSENHHITKGDLAYAREVGKITREEGLTIAGYGSYFRLGEGMQIRPSIETSLALGTDNIRIWAGSKPSSILAKEEREILLNELQECVNVASKYNVTLNLEWHKNTLTDENCSALDTLEKISDKHLKTLWQPTQALSFKERVEGLEMVLPFLNYLHVYYWNESGRRPLDEGKEYWERYFSVLDKAKNYFALLEFVLNDSEEQFFSDAKTLLLLTKGEK